MKEKILAGILGCSLLGLILIGPGDMRRAIAQAHDTPDRVQQLEARIQQLEQRLAKLEALLKQRPEPPQAKKPASTDIPEDIDQIIRDRAADKYPDKYHLQKNYIDMEQKAYQNIQNETPPDGVPNDIYQKIKTAAADKYPDKYHLQKNYIDMECKAYLDVQ